jgi:hypothetical protein
VLRFAALVQKLVNDVVELPRYTTTRNPVVRRQLAVFGGVRSLDWLRHSISVVASS